MDATFWQQRWKENRTSFHEERPNALLAQHFHRLSLDRGARVFVPLCGKSNDLAWLSEQGHRVVGIELNLGAVEAAFSRMDGAPEVGDVGSLTRYRSDAFELFVGDVFDLSADVLGAVDATYDRAALVALPADMRTAYATHLTALTGAAPQFLVTYEYDQSQMDGPPFSVTGEDIGKLYGDRYRVELVASVDISGPLAERCSGTENAWLLKPI